MIDKCMLDLGSSINVMPKSIYTSLDLGPLQPTGITVQLADRSVVYPEGVIEDVLVKVKDLVFPADFYVLKMEDNYSQLSNFSPILLGRPFMRTAKTIIDVHNGTLSMEFDGDKIFFNIYEAMKHPFNEISSICTIDVIDSCVEDISEYDLYDGLYASLCYGLKEIDNDLISLACDEDYHENLSWLQSSTYSTHPLLDQVKPSVEFSPELDLKPLPKHLKYVYLEKGEKLPVIIANNLNVSQEERLINVLKENKMAIGWTLSDIRGISPSTCMHKINLEEGVKPSREAQRRLNPPMMEVVKKEILKLLSAGVIYPISDSEWVSPIHVVPKKTGLTVVENKEGELVPTRVQNGWTVCIDYRKLNAATRKDHFPLPFIDQMLERLAGRSHYCFLDGYSGYNQNCHCS